MRPNTLSVAVTSVAATLLAASPAVAQNYFTDPVAVGDTTVGIRDFAAVPNPFGNQPARVSVMTTDPSGRLFANDQYGPLYTISGDGQTVTPYLDLRTYGGVNLRGGGGEQGFQSFAFHPDFYNSGTAGFGKFYTLQSSNNTGSYDFNPGTSGGGNINFSETLLEWTAADPNASTFTPADAASPFREVIRFAQPFGNHNGGLVSFNTTGAAGDAGNLYIALGDGGSGGDPQENGQDSGNPYGAVLRINPLGNNSANGNYGIVADNALASDGNPDTLGEIYSFGLRNPQRFGWDDATGNLYIADIGQNAVEEIDLAVNGGNFGWDEQEGSFDFEGGDSAAFLDPVAEYDHTNTFVGGSVTGNRAVTVGEVARGTGIAGLDGKLLLGDFPSGVMMVLDVDSDPLDGGQSGLFELVTLDENGDRVRLIDLINQTRAANNLGAAGRADLRYSVGTDGQVFVLNKQDGTIRQLVAVPEPASLAALGLFGLAALRRRRA